MHQLLRWAMPLPAERFSDAGDRWLLEFMQVVNVTYEEWLLGLDSNQQPSG